MCLSARERPDCMCLFSFFLMSIIEWNFFWFYFCPKRMQREIFYHCMRLRVLCDCILLHLFIPMIASLEMLFMNF